MLVIVTGNIIAISKEWIHIYITYFLTIFKLSGIGDGICVSDIYFPYKNILTTSCTPKIV